MSLDRKKRKVSKFEDEDAEARESDVDDENVDVAMPSDDEDKVGAEDHAAGKDEKERIATVEQLRMLQCTRRTLVQWASEVFLPDIVRGLYVRIPIGKDINRIFEIKDIIDNKGGSYMVGDVKVSRRVVCCYPGYAGEKPYRFQFLSNQPFTQEEFDSFKKDVDRSGNHLPTIEEMEKKIKAIKDKRSHVRTEKEIEEIVAFNK